eukprot:2788882-Pyramimonas_sp.AAC.1
MLDVARDFEATSTYEGEKYFRDVWGGVSENDRRHLSEPRTELICFYKRPEITPESNKNARGRQTRAQATFRPDH